MTHEDTLAILPRVALFRGLDEPQLRRAASVLTARRFEEGDVLMREGEPGDTLCVLCDGEVQVTQSLTLRGAGGAMVDSEKSFNVLDARKLPVLGEIAVVDKEAVRSATVTARRAGWLLEMKKADFDRFVEEDPAAGCLMLRHICERVCALLRNSNADVLKLTTALSLALGR